MLSGIPGYINAKSLTINRTERFSQNDGQTQELTAADPEGDTLRLGEWTEDVGPFWGSHRRRGW